MDTTVHLVNSAIVPLEIPGVLVRFFTTLGVLVTQATTDAAGEVDVDLPVATYLVRVSKYQVGFSNPYSISVSATLLNSFTIVGDELANPIASDPNYCRTWGYFIDGAGRPFHGIAVYLRPLVTDIEHTQDNSLITTDVQPGFPVVVGGRGIVASEILELETDETGLGWVDLPRSGKYVCQAKGAHINTPIQIETPDAPGVNILDLMYPYPIVMALSPLGPYATTPGNSLSLAPTFTLSDGRSVPSYQSALGLEVSSSNDAIATVVMSAGLITIHGVVAGAATITVDTEDFAYSKRFPPTPFTLVVTVS